MSLAAAKPVLFSEEKLGSLGLGVIELNNPRALNALSLEMFELISAQLKKWQDRPEIAAVFLHSGLAKSFSAGGDVKAVVQGLREGQGLKLAQRYFSTEYQTDLQVFEYPKPIIVWGEGYIFGGGFGLYHACSHRIVTETARFAMPELAIGFFPDVGITYWLSQWPDHLGEFISLTGYRLNFTEALHLGVAQAYSESRRKAFVKADLLKLPWSESPDANHQLLNSYFSRMNLAQKANESFVLKYQKDIGAILSMSWDQAFQRLENWARTSPEIEQVLSPLFKGSPHSAALIHQLFHDSLGHSYKDILARDTRLARELSQHPDFLEGVRAVLIDKDQAPKWQPKGSLKISSAVDRDS